MLNENARVLFWIGLGDLLLGGALMAFWGGPTGTAVGTVIGFAGIVLMAWAWFSGRRGG